MIRKLMRRIKRGRKPEWYMQMPTGAIVATERFINKIVQQPKPLPPKPKGQAGG